MKLNTPEVTAPAILLLILLTSINLAHFLPTKGILLTMLFKAVNNLPATFAINLIKLINGVANFDFSAAPANFFAAALIGAKYGESKDKITSIGTDTTARTTLKNPK